MAIKEDMQVPWGYGTTYKTLGAVRTILLDHYHPEYVSRLCAWLSAQDGRVGVGGTFRADGTQPGLPGFAPEGTSFHQNQQYSDGFIGACAVDLVVGVAGAVHRAPLWAEVPAQGSAWAALWGVHVNVGSAPTGEPWHMQPVEIDGHGSWLSNGSPAPVAGYPYPGRTLAEPPPKEDDMNELCTVWIDKSVTGPGAYLVSPAGVVHLDGPLRDRYIALGVTVVEGTNVEVSASYRLAARGLGSVDSTLP